MRTKRFLSIVLTLAMLVGMFPGMSLTAYAEGNAMEITPTNTSGTMTITLTIKAAQTITATDVTATYGDTDKSVSASVTTPASGGGTITYAVKDGSVDYIDVASDGKLTIKKVPASGKAYVIVKAAATDDYAETTKEVTVTISKAEATVTAKDQSIMVGSTVPDLSAPVLNTHYSVTGLVGTDALTTAPTLAYQKNGSAATPDSATAGTYDIVPSGASAGDNYNISYTNGTLTISDKGTQTISAENVTVTYGETGKSISATVTEPATGGGDISYAVKTGSADYIDVDASTGALTIKTVPEDGKAYVTVTAAETSTYAQATKEVTVTINKANAVAATVTANSRTYDGTDKPLVTVTGTPTGGTMQYALGTATEATQPYTTSIHTETNAGTYYVWYKVVGDDNHYDSEPDFVAVTISHKYTEVAGVPATCTEAGKKQHWKDEEGTLYKDAEGKETATEAELAIPALGHKYGAWTKLDDTQHQRVCEHDKTHVEKADHTWDSGKVTKEATTTAEGVKTFTCTVCKATKTESIPKLNPAPTSKPVLAAKGIAKGKTAVNLSWNKVSGADRYVIYFARCNQKGRSYVLKKVKTVNGKTLKWSKGKLAKNTAYKFYVVAQKKSGKSYKNIAKSKVGHFYTGNVKGKYTNPRSLTLKKSAYTLKKGKTATIKASVSKVKTNKKLATSHAATYRYTSNNPAVATVNAKGKVTAKAKGTAVIYVQTINGIWKTCKVTVN